MFHYRSAPDYSALDHRLRAIEGELQRIGRKAGRQASATSEQIGDALAPIMSEIADRIRSGGRYAGDEAAHLLVEIIGVARADRHAIKPAIRKCPL